MCCLFLLNLNLCFSLNDEGGVLLKIKERVTNDPNGVLLNWIDEVGVESPCSWFGVECSQQYIVALNLKDLCLSGTLAPDIGDLVHMKSIILRNNSFSGVIPEDIANLKQLEVLDLGYNNFNGQIPHKLGDSLSISVLLVDNNELLSRTSPEINEHQKLSEVQVDELLLSSTTRASWKLNEKGNGARRKLAQDSPPVQNEEFFFPPFPLPPPEDSTPPPDAPPPQPPPPTPAPSPEPSGSAPSPFPATPPISPSSHPTPEGGPTAPPKSSRRNHNRILIISLATGGPLLLLLTIGICFWQSGKVSTVKPWVTGLSGQLQRAFVTGVPKLKRSELEAACEDFSNVIGSASSCTLYKGTLSSGVEIAVASIAVASAKDWSNSMEAQFRKKIDTLSKVNHKNFVSLIGYCGEEEPFTRMMVFEYAPNGTLFEHIHIREAEHLNWATRLRIAMGMAYCLEHMHQLTPPLVHKNFKSSSVYLTEDYAAKISDFYFSTDDSSTETEPNVQSNVYSFGVVLYEMITGKLPYTAGSTSLEDWASDYLGGTRYLREMVDPTLETYSEDQLQQIGRVIRGCTCPDPRERLSMKEVCVKLREITGIEPDGAIPKLSPLWWAEIEIMSESS